MLRHRVPSMRLLTAEIDRRGKDCLASGRYYVVAPRLHPDQYLRHYNAPKHGASSPYAHPFATCSLFLLDSSTHLGRYTFLA